MSNKSKPRSFSLTAFKEFQKRKTNMIIYNKPKPLTHPEETNEMSSHSCELLRFKQRLEKYIRRNDQDSCLRRSCEPKTFELVVPESPEEVNQPRENKHPQHYLTKIVKVTNRKRFNPCKWITASLGQTKVMPKMSEEQEIRNQLISSTIRRYNQRKNENVDSRLFSIKELPIHRGQQQPFFRMRMHLHADSFDAALQSSSVIDLRHTCPLQPTSPLQHMNEQQQSHSHLAMQNHSSTSQQNPDPQAMHYQSQRRRIGNKLFKVKKAEPTSEPHEISPWGRQNTAEIDLKQYI